MRAVACTQDAAAHAGGEGCRWGSPVPLSLAKALVHGGAGGSGPHALPPHCAHAPMVEAASEQHVSGPSAIGRQEVVHTSDRNLTAT